MGSDDALPGPDQQYLAAKRTDPRSNEQLIDQALAATDEEAAWEPVSVLWYRPNDQVLDIARRLFESGESRKRQLAARIIGQGGKSDRMAPQDSLGVLLPQLDRENDAAVLSDIGYALGQIADPAGVEPLIRFKDHADPQVRYGVAQGLLRQRDPRAIATLVELSGDLESNVRDWATFGLTLVEDVDSPEVRDALVRRLQDANDETRAEALLGLAQRSDPRVVEPLLEERTRLGNEVPQLIFEAAVTAGNQLGDPRLHPLLLRLRKFSASDSDHEALEAAIKLSEPTKG